ncbi:MAG: VOC family protein, partial [Myxococcota bacterium]|nr:VOC family protein [Myxococcota bacterium]
LVPGGERLEDHGALMSRVYLPPNGVPLEVVAPEPGWAEPYTHPVICFAVGDLTSARSHLTAQGVDLLARSPSGCQGFRGPGGAPYVLTERETAPVTEGVVGVEWILIPTTDFEGTVDFFQRVINLTVEQSGTAVNDLQFRRYGLLRAPDGVVLEVVELNPERPPGFTHPVPSITVGDLGETRAQMERQGLAFLTGIVDTGADLGWTYLRPPGAETIQLQGPYSG